MMFYLIHSGVFQCSSNWVFPIYSLIAFFLFIFYNLPVLLPKLPSITSLSSLSLFLLCFSFLLPAQKLLPENFFLSFLLRCFLGFLPIMFDSFLLDSYLSRSPLVSLISPCRVHQPSNFQFPSCLFLRFQSLLPVVSYFPYHIS